MSQKGDLRRHARSPKSSPIQIAWKDRQGVDRVVSGRVIDVSESGVRVETTESIDKQTYVTIQASSLALHGSASVRTCNRRGLKFLLGLEFSAGMKWKPKPGESAN